MSSIVFHLTGDPRPPGVAIAGPFCDRELYDRFVSERRGGEPLAESEALVPVLPYPLVEAGDAEAMHLLGLSYFRGQGVEQDLVQARELQQSAADGGSLNAAFELSLLLSQGHGGPADPDRARHYEAQAAEESQTRSDRHSCGAQGRRPRLRAFGPHTSTGSTPLRWSTMAPPSRIRSLRGRSTRQQSQEEPLCP